jgi:hypothetical protein
MVSRLAADRASFGNMLPPWLGRQVPRLSVRNRVGASPGHLSMIATGAPAPVVGLYLAIRNTVESEESGEKPYFGLKLKRSRRSGPNCL